MLVSVHPKTSHQDGIHRGGDWSGPHWSCPDVHHVQSSLARGRLPRPEHAQECCAANGQAQISANSGGGQSSRWNRTRSRGECGQALKVTPSVNHHTKRKARVPTRTRACVESTKWLLPSVIFGVALGESVPLFRQVVQSENG